MRRKGSSGRCSLKKVYPTLRTIEDIHKSMAWIRVDVRPDGCWHWAGVRLKNTGRTLDYGVINVGRKLMKAHVLVKMFFEGTTERGPLHYLHTCDVPYCVNPDHIFRGTNQENHADKVRKGRHWQQQKTHCAHGHPYDAANTYTPPGAPTSRQCRTCKGIPLLTTSVLDRRPPTSVKLPAVTENVPRRKLVKSGRSAA